MTPDTHAYETIAQLRQVIDAYDSIEALRQVLAEKDAEIERLQADRAHWSAELFRLYDTVRAMAPGLLPPVAPPIPSDDMQESGL